MKTPELLRLGVEIPAVPAFVAMAVFLEVCAVTPSDIALPMSDPRRIALEAGIRLLFIAGATASTVGVFTTLGDVLSRINPARYSGLSIENSFANSPLSTRSK